MDSEDKRNVWMLGVTLSVVVALLIVIAAWHCAIVQTYVEKGYSRTTLPGAEYTYWVKPNETP